MPEQSRFGFVVEYVKDIHAAKRFYEDVLGLRVERAHPTFVQFDHFGIASDEPMSGNGAPETYWLVENAERAFQEMSAKAEVIFPIRQMPFGKVFGIRDPDGLPQYLLEFAANRPSKPTQ